MADEIMMSIASALASKTADAAFDSAQRAWGRLVQLIREKFGHDKNGADAAALEAAQLPSADEDAVRQLATALELLAVADPHFGGQLSALWPQASAELAAPHGDVVNVNAGTVGGHLIQASELRVEGGLHLGDAKGPNHS